MFMPKKHNSLKLTPKMIIRRGHYLYFAYYWLYGKINDLLFARKSLDDTVFNNDKEAYPIQSLSYPYLKELSKSIIIYPEDVFVDVGCAWGRVLWCLRRKKYAKKWIGVEYNSRIEEQAKKIFSS